MIEHTATTNGLPVEYLSRLLWIESGFNSTATSPAGAEGIAQFMPETAAEHGLSNARDPSLAIPHAASLLANLHRQFGNLGLAAAAYNAGPGRVAKWLHGISVLPDETRIYVRLITKQPVEQWQKPGPGATWITTNQSCAASIAELIRTRPSQRRPFELWAPSPVAVSSDGQFVTRRTGQRVSIPDRLAVHQLLQQAIGLGSRP